MTFVFSMFRPGLPPQVLSEDLAHFLESTLVKIPCFPRPWPEIPPQGPLEKLRHLFKSTLVETLCFSRPWVLHAAKR